MGFAELGLNDELLDAIEYMGFNKPTPVQEKSIPLVLKGKDLIACAQTGTGKTAAYLLPIINGISETKSRATSALILVPTRELAVQIDQQVQGTGYTLGITSIPVYGGGDGNEWGNEKKALTDGADIIIATPGKLISHLNMGYVKLETLKYLVLDEADRMLDIGFMPDINKIMSFVPEKRQTLMFSATMAPRIRDLAQKILVNPEEISIAVSKPAEGVLEAVYLVHDEQKNKLISHLITGRTGYNTILIFCSTKKKVLDLARILKKTEPDTEWISSDLPQKERENVLLRFRAGRTRILVATDVLSRGIDIKDISLIINFDVPDDAEDYVHRVGRTARAESKGVAISLVNSSDMYKLNQIEQLTGNKIYKSKLPEGFGEGPEWKLTEKKKSRNSYYKNKNKRKR